MTAGIIFLAVWPGMAIICGPLLAVKMRPKREA